MQCCHSRDSGNRCHQQHAFAQLGGGSSSVFLFVLGKSEFAQVWGWYSVAGFGVLASAKRSVVGGIATFATRAVATPSVLHSGAAQRWLLHHLLTCTRVFFFPCACRIGIVIVIVIAFALVLVFGTEHQGRVLRVAGCVNIEPLVASVSWHRTGGGAAARFLGWGLGVRVLTLYDG